MDDTRNVTQDGKQNVDPWKNKPQENGVRI
jgi:hypothetical protein